MTDPHLDSDLIAAWAERRLPPDLRGMAVNHLAGCAACRREVTEASTTVQGSRRRRRLAALPLVAAAAAAVVVFGADRFSGAATTPVESRYRSDRANPDGPADLATFAPGDKATVATRELVFIWQGDGPDAMYRFTLTDTAGEQIWQETLGDTTVVLPQSVELVRGGRYLWFVDVLLPDARKATTGLREFTLAR